MQEIISALSPVAFPLDPRKKFPDELGKVKSRARVNKQFTKIYTPIAWPLLRLLPMSTRTFDSAIPARKPQGKRGQRIRQDLKKTISDIKTIRSPIVLPTFLLQSITPLQGSRPQQLTKCNRTKRLGPKQKHPPKEPTSRTPSISSILT